MSVRAKEGGEGEGMKRKEQGKKALNKRGKEKESQDRDFRHDDKK